MKILEVKRIDTRRQVSGFFLLDKIGEIIDTVNQLVKTHNNQELNSNKQAKLSNELDMKELEERN